MSGEDNDDFWFHAKSFGWGWAFPARWQGWAAFVTYAALLFGVRFMNSIPAYRTPYVIGITVLLVVIIVWKGERPLRWRWGRD